MNKVEIPPRASSFSAERIELDDEVNEFIRDFDGKPRDHISAESVVRNADRVGFFSEAAYAYYFPSLVRFLENVSNENENAADLLLYGILSRGLPNRELGKQYGLQQSELKAAKEVLHRVRERLPNLRWVVDDLLDIWENK